MLVRGGEKESVLEIIENFKSSLVSYANKAALNGSFTKLKHICLTWSINAGALFPPPPPT